MKKKFYILLAFCLLMTFSVGCAQITIKRGDIDTGFTKSDYSKFKKKKSVTLKFDLDKNTKYDLEISNDCGNVEVLPSNSDQLEVYGEVYYTDKKDISENYEFIKCHVDDKLASIKANREKYKTNDFIVNLKVLVPEQDFAKVNIDTSNGTLNMKGSKIANSEINISNGTVDLKDSNFTNIVINTSNSEIALNNTEFVNLEGNASNGSIEVNDVSNIAEKMILTNSNGPININLSNVENDIKLKLLGLDSINCKANINESKYKLDEASGELSKIEANNDTEHTLIGEIGTSNGDITIK